MDEKKYERNQDWFDEECKKAIDEKNKCRLNIFQKETRKKYELYKESRRKTFKICRRKKRQMMENKIKKIEEMNENSEDRIFYQCINRMKKGDI